MAGAPLPTDVHETLKKLSSDIEAVKLELQSNAPCENDQFDEEDFWKTFVELVQVISHETTKFCIVFSSGPIPTKEQCQVLADGIESITKKFVHMYLGFPNSRGKMLRNALYQFVNLVVYAVEDLCGDIEAQREHNLKSVGSVWHNCKAVEQLPQNNKDAVLAIFQIESSIIIDAKDELKDAIENETEGQGEEEIRHAFMQNGIRIPVPNRWSESDRQVVKLNLKLVEVFSACLKRTSKSITENGNNRDDQSIEQLDEVGTLVKFSSALVDDLVSSLYPPTSHSAILHYAQELKEKTTNLLTLFENSHYCSHLDVLFVTLFRDAANTFWDQIHDRLATA